MGSSKASTVEVEIIQLIPYTYRNNFFDQESTVIKESLTISTIDLQQVTLCVCVLESFTQNPDNKPACLLLPF